MDTGHGTRGEEVSHGGLANLAWRTSAQCAQTSCVEVADLPDGSGMAVRDSKQPAGPVLMFTAQEWAVFVASVKAGEFG